MGLSTSGGISFQSTLHKACEYVPALALGVGPVYDLPSITSLSTKPWAATRGAAAKSEKRTAEMYFIPSVVKRVVCGLKEGTKTRQESSAMWLLGERGRSDTRKGAYREGRRAEGGGGVRVRGETTRGLEIQHRLCSLYKLKTS